MSEQDKQPKLTTYYSDPILHDLGDGGPTFPSYVAVTVEESMTIDEARAELGAKGICVPPKMRRRGGGRGRKMQYDDPLFRWVESILWAIIIGTIVPTVIGLLIYWLR